MDILGRVIHVNSQARARNYDKFEHLNTAAAQGCDIRSHLLNLILWVPKEV